MIPDNKKFKKILSKVNLVGLYNSESSVGREE